MNYCKTCDYRTVDLEEKVGTPVIFCRRFPPIPISIDIAVQPITTDDSKACGEYKQAEIKMSDYIGSRSTNVIPFPVKPK